MQVTKSQATASINFTGLVGFVIAAGCSWIINHSVAWAIFHGLCGFFYILYLCMGFGGGFGPVDAFLTGGGQ